MYLQWLLLTRLQFQEGSYRKIYGFTFIALPVVCNMLRLFWLSLWLILEFLLNLSGLNFSINICCYGHTIFAWKFFSYLGFLSLGSLLCISQVAYFKSWWFSCCYTVWNNISKLWNWFLWWKFTLLILLSVKCLCDLIAFDILNNVGFLSLGSLLCFSARCDRKWVALWLANRTSV